MISKFMSEYRFLSNFYPSEVEFDGKIYPTVEHAYQAAKTEDDAEREKIRLAISAGEAKKLGQSVQLIENRDLIKFLVMWELLNKKFEDPKLAQKLKNTGNQELIEGNDWGDVIWGVCKGYGINMLGIMLMAVRSKL